MRIVVLGLGLIGGSVALAARRRLGAEVLGWDHDPAAVRRAELRGALDRALAQPEEAGAADLWIAATPVGALAGTLTRALAGAGDAAVVTDVGSTKRALQAALPAPSYIGGHPLTGAETSGIEHASEDLFDGATWYLTPRPGAPGDKFERLHRFVSALGAVPTAIDAEEHDRVMAAVSHLPHVLANVLVEAAGGALHDGAGLGGVRFGPSFRDATRVAGANPELWAQIYAENAEALGAQLDGVITRLLDVRGRLGDLRGWQEAAARHRADLLAGGLHDGPVTELRVWVPNRPGVVAELALALGRAGINISDMALAPAFDNRGGTVALWVPSAHADRARELVGAQGELLP